MIKIKPTPAPPKCVLVGDTGVGKTVLMRQWRHLSTRFVPSATIGADFHCVTFRRNGSEFNLNVWDTAGQERFQSVSNSYLRNADAAVIMYDISDRATFDHVPKWHQTVLSNASDQGCVFVIVGNKLDSAHRRKVSTAEGEMLAATLESGACPVLFLESSAKVGVNTDLPLNGLVDRLMQRGRLVPESPRGDSEDEDASPDKDCCVVS